MSIESNLAPGVPLTPISRSFAKVRIISSLWALIPLIVIAVLNGAVWQQLWIWIVLALLAVSLVVTVAIRVRAVYHTEYYIGEDDVTVGRGIMFRRVDVVPYARMQEVNVEAGPIQRHWGLASVTMETASTTTDVSIPGIETAEADRLRKLLTEAGNTKMEGL